MKKNFFALLTLAGVALAFTGCQSTGELVLLSKGVDDSVYYNQLKETRLPDGRMEVSARLHNREERRIQVQVNCQFKNKEGVVIDATPFQNVFLDENAAEYLKFVSMNDQAQRYLISVREAR